MKDIEWKRTTSNGPAELVAVENVRCFFSISLRDGSPDTFGCFDSSQQDTSVVSGSVYGYGLGIGTTAIWGIFYYHSHCDSPLKLSICVVVPSHCPCFDIWAYFSFPSFRLFRPSGNQRFLSKSYFTSIVWFDNTTLSWPRFDIWPHLWP